MRHTTAAALACAAALALTGCSLGGSGAAAPEPVADTATVAEPAGTAPSAEAAPEEPTAAPEGQATAADAATGEATGEGTAEATDAAPGDGASAAAPGADAGASAPVDLAALNLGDRHPNGTVLQLTSLEVQRTGMVLGVSITNGFTDEIKANRFLRNMWLVDDVGNSYNFRAPDQNAELAVQPGEELVGDLVFLGVLDPAATELTFKSNVNNPDETVDLANRFDRDTTPKLLVTGIPVA